MTSNRKNAARIAVVGTLIAGTLSVMADVAGVLEFPTAIGDLVRGSGANGARLQAELPTVEEPIEPQRSSMAGAAKTNASLPRFETTLRNTGTDTATVEFVEAEVLEYAALQWCGTPGGGGDGQIDVEATARIVLPEQPQIGSRIRTRISGRGLEIPEGDPNAIGVYFETPEFGPRAVYTLRLSVIDAATNHRQPIGDVVLSSVYADFRGYLPDSPQPVDHAGQPYDRWCLAYNLRRVTQALEAAPDAAMRRTDRLGLIEDVDRRWNPGRTPAQAKADALRLLRAPESGFGPTRNFILATAAADGTGDAAFATRIRRIAIDRLVALGASPNADDYERSSAGGAILQIDPTNERARAWFTEAG